MVNIRRFLSKLLRVLPLIVLVSGLAEAKAQDPVFEVYFTPSHISAGQTTQVAANVDPAGNEGTSYCTVTGPGINEELYDGGASGVTFDFKAPDAGTYSIYCAATEYYTFSGEDKQVMISYNGSLVVSPSLTASLSAEAFTPAINYEAAETNPAAAAESTRSSSTDAEKGSPAPMYEPGGNSPAEFFIEKDRSYRNFMF